jgi:hypothetical protein
MSAAPKPCRPPARRRIKAAVVPGGGTEFRRREVRQMIGPSYSFRRPINWRLARDIAAGRRIYLRRAA